jgi:hypothetical protein
MPAATATLRQASALAAVLWCAARTCRRPHCRRNGARPPRPEHCPRSPPLEHRSTIEPENPSKRCGLGKLESEYRGPAADAGWCCSRGRSCPKRRRNRPAVTARPNSGSVDKHQDLRPARPIRRALRQRQKYSSLTLPGSLVNPAGSTSSMHGLSRLAPELIAGR